MNTILIDLNILHIQENAWLQSLGCFETNMLLIFQITSGNFTYTDNFVKWDTLTWTKCLLVYYYEGCIIFSCFIRNPLKPSLYLQNDLLPEGTISGQNRHGYTISNVDRFHAGRYTCHADNGVGAAATAKIALQVLCKYNKLNFEVMPFECTDISINIKPILHTWCL